MIYRFDLDKIKQLVLSQIRNFYFESPTDEELLTKYMPVILERLERNFSYNSNKYYSSCRKSGDENTREAYFDPLHTCQWMIFCYFASNTIYKADKSVPASELCDKLYGISKMVSGADVYYAVNLPDEFCCDHPVGSVIGRAEYGKGFTFIQGCTVGNNRGCYPVIGENVKMYSNSKILGKCKIGNNVTVAANTFIKDQDVPDNVIVFGASPNLIFKVLDKKGV